jgi:tetratricopeptide (TPR) repeat protein
MRIPLFFCLSLSSLAHADEWMPDIENSVHMLSTSFESITSRRANALERRVTRHPEDAEARVTLLTYYRRQYQTDACPQSEVTEETSAAIDAALPHAVWFVEQQSDYGMLLYGLGIKELAQCDAHAHSVLDETWDKVLADAPDNPATHLAASYHYSLYDAALALAPAQRAAELAPGNLFISTHLAFTYGRLGQPASALELREAILDQHPDIEEAACVQSDAATDAMQAEQWDVAAQHAKGALDLLQEHPDYWCSGDVNYQSHQILGLIALRDNDIDTANLELIAASHGPEPFFRTTWALAAALREQGQQDTVLKFLDGIKTFSEEAKDPAWREMIESGKLPPVDTDLR